jgi:hypothetical protein
MPAIYFFQWHYDMGVFGHIKTTEQFVVIQINIFQSSRKTFWPTSHSDFLSCRIQESECKFTGPNTGHVKIIRYQFGAKLKLVFCAKYNRGLDLGFWEILKPLKWTNITSFFLIKTNGWKDLLKFLYLKFSVNLNKIHCVRSGVVLVLLFQILIFSFIKAFLRLRL